MTTAAPAVRIEGDLAVVAFGRYDLAAYELFLKTKKLPEQQIVFDWRADTYTLTTPARFAPMLGVQTGALQQDRLPLAPHLFDYQAWAVKLALDAKRFAVWLDTGLGKMAVGLEWARQVMHVTGGRVLILAPVVELIRQYGEETVKFYGGDLPIEVIHHADELPVWCKGKTPAIGICTYHKFIPGVVPELRHLAGIVADESSILKTGGGTIKWNLIKSAKGIEYKLSMTATPAPNEAMEYASQASFLEKLRSEGEVIWTFFADDKYGNWKVKEHAKTAFYRFLASWSLYMRDPAAFGFADILSTLPAPDIQERRLPLTEEQQHVLYRVMTKQGQGMLVDDRIPMTVRSKLMQAARGFQYDGKGGKRGVLRVESHKPAYVAEWTREQVEQGRPTLIWTTFDEEAVILLEHLDGVKAAALDGDMADEDRADTLDAFKDGRLDVLISKPQLIGYGLNLQHAKSMAFNGFDDSFERIYQATRRAVRFGQTDRVRVLTPYIPELEGLVFGNIKRKEQRFMEDVAEMESHYIVAQKEIAAL